MHTPSVNEQLIQKVIDGEKPGTFIDEHPKVVLGKQRFKRSGLEGVAGHYRAIAVAFPRPASEVIRSFALTERLGQYSTRMDRVVGEIGDKTIAATLAALDAYPRHFDPRRNVEEPEVAILEGALLGYNNCCVDYYVATRYEGVPEDPVTTLVTNSIDFDKWPDSHVLCRACGIELAATLG
jgi:hypothetical protein